MGKTTNTSPWRCTLCGRTEIEVGNHPLPVKQKAHLFPNRLSGAKPRYGGVKSPFQSEEWGHFLSLYKKDFGIPDEASNDEAKSRLGKITIDLCGECHEEVLSEPIYLPAVLDKLRPYFQGKSRIEKITLMIEVIRLGATAFARDRNGT